MGKLLHILFSVALCAQCLHAIADSQIEKGADRPLKVLMIGNSFSICCLWQTPQIADAYGYKLDLASLYIGGCSLERHWQNVERARTEPNFKPYRYDRISEGRRTADNQPANIPETLKSEQWDIVTIQQCSHLSWDAQSYRPFGDKLVKTIRELAPGAEILVQETWSYPPWDKRLAEFGFDQVDMYAKLHDAYAAFAGEYGFRIIPTGTAAEFCPDRNRLFTEPDFHFSKLDGEYLQGLVWAGTLFGLEKVGAKPCRYVPSGIAHDRAQILWHSAVDAVKAASLRNGAKKSAIHRVFRNARITRGNTNVLRLQPIDNASWIWLEGDSGVLGPGGKKDWQTNFKFVKFRKNFTVEKGDGTLVIDVSADERFYLTLDGQFVARGPNRGTVENWQYQTYVIDGLEPGEHKLEAVVWVLGEHGPLAQLSHRGGFICKALGAYDKKLTTGVASWQAGRLENMLSLGSANGVWGTGAQFEISGRGPYSVEPAAYSSVEVVRGPAGVEGPRTWGGRTAGWMLFPSQLPDQTELRGRPFTVKAVAADVPWRKEHVYTEAEAKSELVGALNALVQRGVPCVIPANTRAQAAVDCGQYTCAYPELVMKGAKGARVSWTWTESAREPKKPADKYARKGNRGELFGKYLDGYGDVFVCDGEEGAFSTPWFRCGRWCRLDIETGDKPLVLTKLGYIESRYPLEQESSLSSSSDQSIESIRRISTRAMQMCAHEMLFDCPYYEQQMYPGDTRVQLNVLRALSRDDRLIKRAIEIYDLNTRDDGMCPMNFPTRGLQESLSYTLCYLLMYGDYVMNNSDVKWLRARLPGMRKSMAGVEYYENEQGLIENPPGWSFMDWTEGWSGDGTVPGTYSDKGITSELNLFWLLAMQSAAVVERALGNELQARYWEEKGEKLKTAIVKTFWCEERSLFADNREKDTFSEHSQCLAVLAGVLDDAGTRALFERLVSDPQLKRTTVYFSYYLFDAYFKLGRGDLFVKRLDLWRDYGRNGVTALLESPETPEIESRSDCHAWGAHPLWFMQTGLAGIKSDAPFFARVLVAPVPGPLRDIKARHPHPDGWIDVELKFSGGKVSGRITTPVPGKFVFGETTLELACGENIF